MTAIVKCTCKSEYQDKTYGAGTAWPTAVSRTARPSDAPSAARNMARPAMPRTGNSVRRLLGGR